eukprot:TRINITY_DN3415_c0_g1_i3.p1 TRINITY_DN3415_c0_g1~~TRINITY_DN3415_c0_g1_i3.p1  ORF type:complete len:801 (+),score=314.00 TRINITY_DN3415_c0_g1_i3:205-2607(+)
MAPEAVDMYREADMWDQAHSVAKQCMSDGEINQLYCHQAERLIADQRFEKAERLYLEVNEVDLAITMYKSALRYDDMIRLVAAYRKDLLADTHTHLAQELETQGDYKGAEKHYMEAGEWQGAMNMYRANELWDEAIRVAKLGGGQKASERVAYNWARHLGGEAGSDLLNKLGLIKEAITYAVESGAYDHAFELARTGKPELVPDVHLKHALMLEDESRFEEAEREFINAEKPKEAVDMYLHRQDWAAAMRVAEDYDPTCISDVFVAQGQDAVQRRDFASAESHFLKAKKPDQILEAYKDANMWPEAIRIAKRHLPHKLREVNQAYQRAATSGEGDSSDVLRSAKTWEDAQDYNRAIDAYLRIDRSVISDLDILEEVWENAVKIASQYCKERLIEVSGDVARRLNQIGRNAAAADLFRDAEEYKQAIDCYLKVLAWEKAKQTAQLYAPQYLQYVEGAYTRHLSEKGDASALVKAGNVDQGLEMFAERGEWEKVFEICLDDEATCRKYSVRYATSLCEEHKTISAIGALRKYGVGLGSEDIELCGTLMRQLMVMDDNEDEMDDVENAFVNIRDVLVTMQQEALEAGSQNDEMDKLVLVAHYICMFNRMSLSSMADLKSRVSMSLLRYTNMMPAERLFYFAGVACKDNDERSDAFVYFNRFVDLIEVINKESDIDMLDNTDFLETGLPSVFDLVLGEKVFLSPQRVEDIREWVLQVSMENDVDQELTLESCEECGNEKYAPCLSCMSCNTEYDACIVTGFPIEKSNKVHCTICKSHADKDSFNRYVEQFKACPWCESPQQPIY